MNDKTYQFSTKEYLGPTVDSLTETLQTDIYDVIDEFGINEDLIDFVSES